MDRDRLQDIFRAMGFTLLFVLVQIVTTVPATSQEPPPYDASLVRSDLDRFKASVLLAHPGLFVHESAASFERFYHSLIDTLESPVSAVDAYLLTMRLVARLQDGHARAFVSGDTRSYISRQGILPLHVFVQDDRIFVRRDLSLAGLGDGSEILSIGGVPAQKIIRTLASLLPLDGASASGLAYRLGSGYNSFYRVFPLAFGLRPEYPIAVQDRQTREIRVVSIPLISGGEFDRLEEERYGTRLHTRGIEQELAIPPLSLDLDEAGGLATLGIRRFFGEDFSEPEDTFPTLYREIFETIAASNIKGLIVDLRANGGGIGGNAAHLVRFLSDSTFVPTEAILLRGTDAYYREITKDSLGLDAYFRLTPAGDRYRATNETDLVELRTFAPEPTHRFRGRLVVLIDGGTLSAAGMAAGLLRQYTDAVFVGEETGGYAGMSNGIRQVAVRGTHTDIAINFPLAHSQFGVNRHLRARGVLPDYTVRSSIEDLLSGRDAPLEFARDLLRR